MIQNVVIDGKMYELELKNGKSGSTGICYRLCHGEIDLAVKLYLDHALGNDDELIYPDYSLLQHLIELSDHAYPVLLSHHAVMDVDAHYIGCAAPFIEETAGPTKEAIYTFPTPKIMTYLYQLRDRLLWLTDQKISLCDWSIDNILLGSGQLDTQTFLPFGLYIIDDGGYFEDTDVHFLKGSNFNELNFLICSILEYYLEDHLKLNFMNSKDSILKSNCLNSYSHAYDPIRLFEKESEKYPNLGEYFTDYVQTKRKARMY